MNNTIKTTAITIALLLAATTEMVMAKGGYDDKNRSRMYGIIQAMPQDGLHGEWVIGGHTFITDAGTEFDQAEGDLTIGSCAKVDVRDGRVHEIDSEPMRDCP